MPVGAAVGIAGAGLVSGAMSSSAARSGANAVAQSTDRAAELENQRFQQMLALSMPGYQRAEQAAGLYGRVLGIPSMTGGQNTRVTATADGVFPTGQPGATVSYGGGSMTGGGYTGSKFLDGVEQQQYAPVDYTQPQVNGGPGDGYTSPTATIGLMTGGQSDQQMIYDQIRGTPGYQAQLDQGLKAIDRAAPLVGGMYSGRRMKALQDHGQTTFGSYYNSWMDRLGGIAGQAPQIAQNVGAAGMNSASAAGGLMVQGANARAQGAQNSANAWSNALGTGVSALGYFGGQAGWFK